MPGLMFQGEKKPHLHRSSEGTSFVPGSMSSHQIYEPEVITSIYRWVNCGQDSPQATKWQEQDLNLDLLGALFHSTMHGKVIPSMPTMKSN